MCIRDRCRATWRRCLRSSQRRRTVDRARAARNSSVRWYELMGRGALCENAPIQDVYKRQDDTLVLRLSDKPIVREVSQDWREIL